MDVLDERNIRYKEEAINGFLNGAYELVDNELLTPADIRQQQIKEEQESQAALEKERQASINLENISLEELVKTYDNKKIRELIWEHTKFVNILKAIYVHPHQLGLNTYNYKYRLEPDEKGKLKAETERIKQLFRKLVDNIGVQDNYTFFDDTMAESLALEIIIEDRMKRELEEEEDLNRTVEQERQEYSGKSEELEEGLTVMINYNRANLDYTRNRYYLHKAAKWLDMSDDEILQLRKTHNSKLIKEAVQKRLRELNYPASYSSWVSNSS